MSAIRFSRLSDRQKAEVLRQKIRNAAEELSQLDGSVNPVAIDRALGIKPRETHDYALDTCHCHWCRKQLEEAR